MGKPIRALLLFLLLAVTAFGHTIQPKAKAVSVRGGASRRVVRKPIRKIPARRSGRLSKGDASIPSEVFNLVKAIVGVGVLSLPAGKVLRSD